MQQDNKDVFQAFLWGQTLLFGLLGASLAFFLAHRGLQTYWSLPELKLVLQTAGLIAAGIVALLAGVRFGVEGRRLDLLLCTGFLAASGSTLAFSVVPVLGGHPVHRAEGWAAVLGRLFAWVLIASAPFTRGRSKWGSRVLGNACLAVCVVLLRYSRDFFPRRRSSACSRSSASDSGSARRARTSIAGWLSARR